MNEDEHWGTGDATWTFGLAGDYPVYVDGHIGVFRNGKWYMDLNDNRIWGSGDKTWTFGKAGDRPVIASAFTYNVLDNNMLMKVNAARLNAGLPILTYDNNLYLRTLAHSQDMFDSDTYYHADIPSPGGQNCAPSTLEIPVSYPCVSGSHYVAALADPIASAIMHLYMDHDACAPNLNSHRNSIMDASYGKFGFGTVCGNIGGVSKCYNTQNFGYTGYSY